MTNVSIPGCTAGTDQAHPPKALQLDADPPLRTTALPGWAPGGDTYRLPAAAAAETFPRWASSFASGVIASGTLGVSSIILPKDLTVNGAVFTTDSTVQAGGSHGWYVLLDKTRTVIAATADQTGATAWGTASTPVPLAFTAPVTTAYSGLYYLGQCIVASSVPSFSAAPSLRAGVNAAAPPVCGTAGTGFTTPPALGTQTIAIVPVASVCYYAYTS